MARLVNRRGRRRFRGREAGLSAPARLEGFLHLAVESPQTVPGRADGRRFVRSRRCCPGDAKRGSGGDGVGSPKVSKEQDVKVIHAVAAVIEQSLPMQRLMNVSTNELFGRSLPTFVSFFTRL